MKLLVWLLLGLLVYWALRKQAKRSQQKRDAQKAAFTHPSPPSPPSSAPVEKMVACSYCELYFPTSEAIHRVIGSSEHYFCCVEHAELFAKKSSSE